MRQILPDFAESSPAPVFEVRRPSLAAAMPTAMVLVDYALSGASATPTLDVQVFAQQLPPEVAAASRALRAVLAHGTALREVLLAQVPADHCGHRDWPALKDWIASLEDDEMLGLIEFGIRSNLAYSDPQAVAPRPSGPLVASLVPAELGRMAGVVLTDWGVPDAQASGVDLVERPGRARAVLVELLDLIWSGWLAEGWGRVRDEPLPATVSEPVSGSATAALSGSQWLSWVTGLRPDARYAEAADQASRLVVMACPGLGKALTLFDVDDITFVLHSPSLGSSHRQTDAVGLMALGSVSALLRALGDPTRLSIVLQLIDSGPLTMRALTQATGVHQTTVSRQVMSLREAKLVTLDSRRRVVLQTAAIEEACHTLLAAIQRPVGSTDPQHSNEEN